MTSDGRLSQLRPGRRRPARLLSALLSGLNARDICGDARQVLHRQHDDRNVRSTDGKATLGGRSKDLCPLVVIERLVQSGHDALFKARHPRTLQESGDAVRRVIHRLLRLIGDLSRSEIVLRLDIGGPSRCLGCAERLAIRQVRNPIAIVSRSCASCCNRDNADQLGDRPPTGNFTGNFADDRPIVRPTAVRCGPG
jgi:hypothetical protein